MASLTYLGMTYDCVTAIKGADYIHLLDADGNMVVSFDGISDFSGFTLSGCEYTEPAADEDCFVAIVREDGTIGKGSHKCSDIGKVGIQADYEQNDSTAVDYIKNRPFHDNAVIPNEVFPATTIDFSYNEKSDTYFNRSWTPSDAFIEAWQADWQSATVVWGDSEYTCARQESGAYACIGNLAKYMGEGDSGEPFFLIVESEPVSGAWVHICRMYDLYSEVPADTTTATISHDVAITLNTLGIKKIDPKYLPESAGGSGLPEVTTNDNGKFLQVVDGVWTAVALTDVSQEGA